MLTETEFLDLVSGRRQGVGPALARFGLWLASGFYGTGVTLRNVAYNLGILSPRRAGLPVISIGNITTGGTGKTPFAAWLARWFRNHGVRVCFVSRGYRAESGKQNDEALVLDQLCPDVPHLQNPDRFLSAEIARIELESQLIVLDDGFQHRQLARDLDIVLIDALNPFGYGHWLPRGLLREPRMGVTRAQILVVTRVDQAERHALELLLHRVRGLHPDGIVVQASFPPLGLISTSGTRVPLTQLHGQTVAAFCGIGNPEAFESSLRLAGCRVAAFRRFADHHPYSIDDVTDLTRWTKDVAPTLVVTTQKDLVKLDIDRLGGVPLWALEIGTQIHQGAEALGAKLSKILERIPRDDG